MLTSLRLLGVAALLSSCEPGTLVTSGQLSVRLVDAPVDEVTSVFVTLRSVVAVMPNGDERVLADGPLLIDLLSLQHGNSLSLGDLTMAPGTVAQVRFLVDESGRNDVGFADGTVAPLKIPSSTESGIKLVGPFEIRACQTTRLTLDFDVPNSLHLAVAGQSGKVLLRPVVFVKQLETFDACP